MTLRFIVLVLTILQIMFHGIAINAATAHYVAGQYLVELKPRRTQISTDRIEKALQAKIIDRIRPNVYLVEKDVRLSTDQVVKNFKSNPLVSLAEPNAYVYAFKAPNDPEYRQLWGLANHGLLDKSGMRGIPGVDIGIERAWDLSTGARNIVVAVIDSGIDFTHPELIENAWVNEIEAKGTPGVDDDNNGYIDDINGFNFSANTGIVIDDFGHGSHCAGIIGAKGDNGIGIAGINWNVRLMAVKFLDKNGSGTIANAIKAVDYARIMKAHISNNSWGGNGSSDLLRKAVEDTKTAGQLFIAAAGNSGSDNGDTPIQPAGFVFDNMISVAAIDNRGNLADFSNFGLNSVHLAAPGVNILSTIPGGYEVTSGTSMAAPHVAGVAALVWAQFPNFTYQEVKQRLLDSTRPLVGLKGKLVSGGVLDAGYALTKLKPPQEDPNDPAKWLKSQPYNLETPHPYSDNANDIYTVKLSGATRIAVRFKTFATEKAYDTVQFFNSANESLGTWSGKNDGLYSPVADGDTLIMKLTSDGSNTAAGFVVDQVVFESGPLPDPHPTPEPLPSPVPDPSPTPEPTPVFVR